MFKPVIFFFAAAILTLTPGCQKARLDPLTHLSPVQKESITVEMVTFLGRRPYGVAREDRHNPAHLPHFKELAKEFELVYYYPAEGGRVYYYMFRPARNHQGRAKRGVGGWFETDGAFSITSFTEVFNTPILPEEELKTRGLRLFEIMVETGNVDEFKGKQGYIEWPNDRTRYCEIINEWVFTRD